MASSAMYRLSAMTSATGSPTNFTSPSASGGRGVSGMSLPATACQASLTSGLRSAAVNTACTPGMASAAEASIPLILAWANWLRTKQACSMPGRMMSSTKVPWPVSSRVSSTRGIRVPA